MTEAAPIDLLSDLEKLAHEMLSDAAQPNVKLSERLDVFKTLSNHYVNLAKVKGKNPPPGDDAPTMSSFRKSVEQSADQQGEDDEPTED